MNTVYLLIGLPGCGKSTAAKNLINGASIVSVDEIRQQLSNEGIIGKKYLSTDNQIVFNKFHERIKKEIDLGSDVIADSTNARLSEREAIYALFSEKKPKFIGLNFLVSKEICLQRILKRQQSTEKVHFFNNPEMALETYEKRLNETPPLLSEKMSEIWQIDENGIIIKKDKKILIATTNAGKIDIYASICQELNLYSTNLREISVGDEPIEDGKDEIENAIIKAQFYNKITNLPVIANDSGLIIDKFSPEDQPGVLVRRYGGKDNSDISLLNIYIEKLKQVGGESDGHYNVALALIDKDNNLFTKEFKPFRHFISIPSKIVKKGIPLSSLAFDEKTQKYMSEMTIQERNLYEGEELLNQKKFIEEVFIK